MNRINRRLGTALLGLAAASLLAAATAPAATSSAGTITISARNLRFSGQVTTDNPSCLARRTVHLVRFFGGPDQRLASTKTTKTGAWTKKITGSAGATLGSYYAILRPEKIGRGAAATRCAGARSSMVSPSAVGAGAPAPTS